MYLSSKTAQKVADVSGTRNVMDIKPYIHSLSALHNVPRYTKDALIWVLEYFLEGHNMHLTHVWQL